MSFTDEMSIEVGGTMGTTYVCLSVFLYLYPVACGPKGHGSGGFYTF